MTNNDTRKAILDKLNGIICEVSNLTMSGITMQSLYDEAADKNAVMAASKAISEALDKLIDARWTIKA